MRRIKKNQALKTIIEERKKKPGKKPGGKIRKKPSLERE